jgi:hypothetical protein
MMQISGVPRFGFGISESSLKYVLEGKMNRLCLIAWAVLITAIGMFRLDRWGVRIDDIAKLRIEKLSARRASAPDHLLRADNDLARRKSIHASLSHELHAQFEAHHSNRKPDIRSTSVAL